MAVKVFEFKIYPHKDFQEQFNRWAYGLKKFYNFCLEQFELLDEYTYWDKLSKTRVPCCPVPWSLKLIETLDPNPYLPELKNKHYVSYSNLIAPQDIPVIRNAPEARQYTLKKGETAKDVFKRVKNPDQIVVTTAKPESSGLDKWPRGWLGGVGYSQPPKQDYQPSLIKNFPNSEKTKDAGILVKKETLENSNLPDEIKKVILDVPYKFRSGTLAMLCTSWQEYLKSRSGQKDLKRGKPKYKRYRDRIETIIHPNPNAGSSKPASKDACRLEGDNILVLPSFGKVKIKGLDKRFRDNDGSIPRVKVVKVLKRPSGWYVQLTADINRSNKLFKKPLGAIGIDTGLKEDNWITTDRFAVTKPRWYRESEEKLARLQKELDAKKLQRVILWLNHPDNSIERIKTIFPSIAKEALEKVKACKRPQYLHELVKNNELSTSGLNQLKHFNFRDCEKVESCYLFDKLLSVSNKEIELAERIRKLHEKLKRRRRSHNQKQSTWLTRKYSIIRIEDGLQKNVGKSKAKVSEDNRSFERNAQNSRAGMNKSVLDAAIGGFISLVESKSKEWGRDFKRMKPGKGKAYSQRCPVCHHENKEQKDITNHQDYNCSNCGFTHRSRDVIPGINMILDEFEEQQQKNLLGIETEEQKIIWDDLSKECRQAWRLREKWLSENAPGGGCQDEVNSDKPSNTRKSRRRKK